MRVPSMNGFSDYIELLGENRVDRNKKRIVQSINRFIQMTTEEQFVRDKKSVVFRKDKENSNLLVYFTDSLVEFTEHFFGWYKLRFHREFEDLVPHLNYVVKNIHLFITHLGSVDWFPILDIKLHEEDH